MNPKSMFIREEGLLMFLFLSSEGFVSKLGFKLDPTILLKGGICEPKRIKWRINLTCVVSGLATKHSDALGVRNQEFTFQK